MSLGINRCLLRMLVQLLHLLLADLVWVGYVLLAADTLAAAPQVSAAPQHA